MCDISSSKYNQTPESKRDRLLHLKKCMSSAGFELVHKNITSYYINNCPHALPQDHTGHDVNYDFKQIYR